jgi:hypothetical protein
MVAKWRVLLCQTRRDIVAVAVEAGADEVVQNMRSEQARLEPFQLVDHRRLSVLRLLVSALRMAEMMRWICWQTCCRWPTAVVVVSAVPLGVVENLTLLPSLEAPVGVVLRMDIGKPGCQEENDVPPAVEASHRVSPKVAENENKKFFDINLHMNFVIVTCCPGAVAG